MNFLALFSFSSSLSNFQLLVLGLLPNAHFLSVSKTFKKFQQFTANCLKKSFSLVHCSRLPQTEQTETGTHVGYSPLFFCNWPLLLLVKKAKMSQNFPFSLFSQQFNCFQRWSTRSWWRWMCSVMHTLYFSSLIFFSTRFPVLNISLSILFPLSNLHLLTSLTILSFLIVVICSLLDFSIYTLIFSFTNTHC